MDRTNLITLTKEWKVHVKVFTNLRCNFNFITHTFFQGQSSMILNIKHVIILKTWNSKETRMAHNHVLLLKYDAVSCGYNTCFAVSACDGLCHLTRVLDGVDYTQKSTRSTLAMKLSVSTPVYPWVTATPSNGLSYKYKPLVIKQSKKFGYTSTLISGHKLYGESG